MLVLSIRQPWAWLIVQGYKDVENRTWRTNVRGDFLVHAGCIFDEKGYDWVGTEMEIVLPGIDTFDRGGVIGAVEIVDCVRNYASPWFTGPYAFVLRNPRPLPFVPMRGKPGFFESVFASASDVAEAMPDKTPDEMLRVHFPKLA